MQRNSTQKRQTFFIILACFYWKSASNNSSCRWVMMCGKLIRSWSCKLEAEYVEIWAKLNVESSFLCRKRKLFLFSIFLSWHFSSSCLVAFGHKFWFLCVFFIVLSLENWKYRKSFLFCFNASYGSAFWGYWIFGIL